MNKSLATALIIIAYFVGIGVGFYLTPEYSEMQQKKITQMMDLGQPDKNLDLRYINGMIAHHKSAIYMAEQAIDKSTRSEVRELSHTIIKLDQEDINRLYEYKKAWYSNFEEITEYQQIHLGNVDDQFDLRFLNAMINHHDEAIIIAQEVLTKSSRSEVLTIASNAIASLGSNRQQLTQWREQWYSIK